MKPKVFVANKIPEKPLNKLREHCDVDVNESDKLLSKEEFIEAVRDKDAVISMLTNEVDAEVFTAAPNLRVVANYADGFDNVDVEEANKRGVMVTNTPGVAQDSVGDHALALMLAVSRRVLEGDRFVREGKYKGWKPLQMLGTCLHDKTLGIVGLGKIGQEVAKRARGFDMKVLYHDVERRKDFEKEHNVKYRRMETMLEKVDFLSINVPLNKHTRHLIGEKELEEMKDEVIIVNTSRGAVVDEDALINALENGSIQGAGLDVYDDEEKVRKSLKDMDNVVLTPHIGSSTYKCRKDMAEIAVDSVLKGLKGKKPKALVNDVEVGPGFEHPFYLPDGTPVKTLEGLKEALKENGEEIFSHHVQDGRNDFANWVRDVFNEEKLAEELDKCVNAKSAVRLLEEEL